MTGTERECFKCGATIRRHLSAYEPWDECFKIRWMPASDNNDFVEDTESGGKHPTVATRRFCSRDCLDAFIQMDYPLKPRSVDTGTDRD
jgi:hypothetical protein